MMDENSTTDQPSGQSAQPPSGSPRSNPPQKAPDEPEGLDKAAAGEDVSEQEEAEALAYLLRAAGHVPEYETTVKLDTPDGIKPIKWVIRAIDGKVFDQIERDNEIRKPGQMIPDINRVRSDAALVVEATVTPNLKDPTFLAGVADPVDALIQQLGSQSGVFQYLAGEVRRISGYDPERVGSASRRLARAVGNS